MQPWWPGVRRRADPGLTAAQYTFILDGTLAVLLRRQKMRWDSRFGTLKQQLRSAHGLQSLCFRGRLAAIVDGEQLQLQTRRQGCRSKFTSLL